MDKKIIISLITAAVIVGGVIWYFNSNNSTYVPPEPIPAPQTSAPAPSGSPAEPSMPPVPAPAPTPAPAPSPAVLSGNVSVAISNYAYVPAKITVKKGTKITWTNNDAVKHNVVSDTGMVLKSPYLATGESWSYTFDQAGSFSYKCVPHPWMTGTVTVVE